MTEIANNEKWMRHEFHTKNASGAWANAQRFFAENNISLAQAPNLQNRFMTASYNSDNPIARAALENLINRCKADHGRAQVFYLSDDAMPNTNAYDLNPIAQ